MSDQGLIFFYGPPLVGKSTLGETFACHLNIPFWDADKIITARAGSRIEDIFAERGESAFRRLEFEVLCDLCTKEHGVVALGGGALLQSQTRDLVEKAGKVVFLTASIQTLLGRMDECEGARPLLGKEPERGLKRLLERREAHYDSFSRKIPVDEKTNQELIDEVEVSLGRFRVVGMGREYEVFIRPGCLAEIGQSLRAEGHRGPIIVVTDDQVGELYAGRVANAFKKAGYPCSLYTFPEGEGSKTLDTVRDVWGHFLNAGMERGGTVVALGGGVVGDIAGFAAAAFHRGIQWVNLPTSLLAMVDASLGGKTGVNLPGGKNLVGAFHPPRQVWVDPNVLCTLPVEELRSGMAEVIKHGVVADPDLFSMAGEGRNGVAERWEEFISRAVGVKVKIVREDPYDHNKRQVLNFGHTVGHGVEHASDYQLRHGEAVAIGMALETHMAEQLGLAAAGVTKKLVEVLLTWGLPVEVPVSLSEQEIWKAIRRDKKVVADRPQFALPLDVGHVRPGNEVEEKVWKSALKFDKEDVHE